MKSLRKLIPEPLHRLTQTEGCKYLPSSVCRILSVPSQVAVPQPSPNVFRLDFLGDTDKVAVKWTGELPVKCKTNNRVIDVEFYLHNFITNPCLYPY